MWYNCTMKQLSNIDKMTQDHLTIFESKFSYTNPMNGKCKTIQTRKIVVLLMYKTMNNEKMKSFASI